MKLRLLTKSEQTAERRIIELVPGDIVVEDRDEVAAWLIAKEFAEAVPDDTPLSVGSCGHCGAETRIVDVSSLERR